MPVAKSYQSLEQIGDIFEQNKRKYVKVKTKTGTIKTVRWYNNIEYQRMYPNEINKNQKSQRDILGFQKGYITLVRSSDEEWLRLSPARYTRYWGWYFISEQELPNNLPHDTQLTELKWEQAEEMIRKDLKKL